METIACTLTLIQITCASGLIEVSIELLKENQNNEKQESEKKGQTLSK